jgi:hypothetical protein
MRKITKKQSKTFNESIEKLLLDNGFKIEVDLDIRKYFSKETNFGKVDIFLYEQSGKVWSIFTCFQNAVKAKTIFNCNLFTGKYNFHEMKDKQERIISNFKFFLEELNFLPL